MRLANSGDINVCSLLFYLNIAGNNNDSGRVHYESATAYHFYHE